MAPGKINAKLPGSPSVNKVFEWNLIYFLKRDIRSLPGKELPITEVQSYDQE